MALIVLMVPVFPMRLGNLLLLTMSPGRSTGPGGPRGLRRTGGSSILGPLSVLKDTGVSVIAYSLRCPLQALGRVGVRWGTRPFGGFAFASSGIDRGRGSTVLGFPLTAKLPHLVELDLGSGTMLAIRALLGLVRAVVSELRLETFAR